MSHALGLLRRAIQLVIIAMFAVLIATVFYQVIGRYLFNAPPSWSEELARFLQVWIALLASALCIQQSMHLGVDYLLYAVPPRGRAALEVLVHLMVSGFLLLLLAYVGWSYVVARLGAARAGVTLHLMPAFGVVLSAIFLSEYPQWFHFAGIALILFGVTLSSAIKTK